MSLFAKFFSRENSSVSPKSKRLSFEPLENRELLDASPVFNFDVAENARGFISGGFTIEEALVAYENARTPATVDVEIDDAPVANSPGQPTIYFDADKSWDDGDDYLCWAATSTNMLWQTGWGQLDGLNNEQELFDYVFNLSFDNDGGFENAGCTWFLNNTTMGYSLPTNYIEGGYYSDYFATEDVTDYITTVHPVDSSAEAVAAMSVMGDAFDQNCGVGLGIYGGGGHAITCWGYNVDTTYSSSDPQYYSGLWITDSDDEDGTSGVLNDRELVYINLEWSDENDFYWFFGDNGYAKSRGWYLSDVSCLVQRPEGVVANKAVPDVSMFETASTIVTTPDDVVDRTDGLISLREAVRYATSGDTIYFDSSLDQNPITLNGYQIEIDKSISIVAESPEGDSLDICIDANYQSNVFDVYSSNVTFEGLTLVNGYETNYSGGAIWVNYADLTLIDCVVQNSESSYAGGGLYVSNSSNITLVNSAFLDCVSNTSGGAVYISSGSLTIEGGELLENVANGSGGAIYVASGAAATIEYGYIADNASSGSGGAVYSVGTTTIYGSDIWGNSTGSSGGAIYVYGGTTSFEACVFAENSAKWGGAIYVSSGTTTIEGCGINDNVATSYCGGVDIVGGTTTIRSSEISGNMVASDANDVYAGAVCVGGGTANIEECVFTDNAAAYTGDSSYYAYGGAFYIYGGATTIARCEISGNSSTNGGGAFRINGGTTTINDCQVTDNYSVNSSGGAFNVSSDGTVTVYQTLISGNVSPYYGGAFETYGKVALYSCTVTGNTGKYGGAFDIDGSTNETLFYNSIVAGNTATSSGADINKYNSSAVVSAYNTLSSYSAWDAGEDNVVYNSSKPLFTDAENGDYTLAENSQAINAGNNDYATWDYDLAGDARVVIAVDLGVYEYQDASPVQLAAPTVSATSTASSITLSWSKVPLAFGYEIDFNGETFAVGSSARSYTFTGLTPSTSYSFVARAFGDGIYVFDSKDVAITAKTTALQQLTRPTVTAEAKSPTSLLISWEAVPNAATYTLSYAVKASSPVYKTATLGGAKTSYLLKGLDANTSYYVKIRANGDNVEFKNSAQSPTFTAKTLPDHYTLATPTLSTSTSASTLAVSWSPVEFAIGYELVFDGETYALEETETSYLFTGLGASTSHSVVVRALGDGRDFANSADATATVSTKELALLSRPVVTANATSPNTLAISWDAIDNASSYTLSYAVKASNPEYATVNLPASMTRYSLRNLAPGTNYYVKIRANGDNVEYKNSAQSPTVTVKTEGTPVVTLETPTITGTTATASTITVEWNAVARAAGYEILCGNQTVTVDADARSYTITGLTASANYSIQMKALGDGTATLDSAYTELVTVKTTALVQLDRPALTVDGKSQTTLDVSWGAIDNASSYTLSYAVKATTPVYTEIEVDATTTSYTITGLSPSTNYYVKVRANGDNVEYKNSSQSPTVTAKTTAGVVTLVAPTITEVSATAATATLNWNAVSGANGYRILFGNQTVTVVDANATSYTFAGLNERTSYPYQIMALGNGSSVLDSPYSELATVQTTAKVQLDRPVLTVTGTTANSISVSWATIPNAKSYNLYYAVKSSSPEYTKAASLGASKTSWTISGLQPGTSYYVKIQAIGDNVEFTNSPNSPTVTAKTAAATSNALLDPSSFEDDYDAFETLLALNWLDD